MKNLCLITIMLLFPVISCDKNGEKKDTHMIQQMKKKTHYDVINNKRIAEKKLSGVAVDLFRKEKENKNSRYHLYAHIAKNDKRSFKSDKEFDVLEDFNHGIYVARENSTGICLLFFHENGKLYRSSFIRDNFKPSMLKTPPEGVVLRVKHVWNKNDEKYIEKFCSPNRKPTNAN